MDVEQLLEMLSDKDKDSYLIPKNVKTRFEFFNGFGWRELFLTLTGIAIGSVIYILSGLFTDSIFRVIIIFVFGAIGFFASHSDPRTGKNVIDFLRDLKMYKSKQKRYMYVFGKGRE